MRVNRNDRVLPGSVIAVWFSCGANSAVAAKIAVDTYPDCTIRVINNPVAEEHPDNRRFLRDVSDWIGRDIEIASNPKYPDNSAEAIWNQVGAMAFPHGAPCTGKLKREARQLWEQDNHHDWIVLGFSLDEKARAEMFALTERSNVLDVLIDSGFTKQDCHDYLARAGISQPKIYDLGFPNANCIGCPKATSPTYWNLVRRTFPDVFEARAKLSRSLGVRLVRVDGRRIFLDELHPSQKGRSLKTMKPLQCGLFCEEYNA